MCTHNADTPTYSDIAARLAALTSVPTCAHTYRGERCWRHAGHEGAHKALHAHGGVEWLEPPRRECHSKTP